MFAFLVDVSRFATQKRIQGIVPFLACAVPPGSFGLQAFSDDPAWCQQFTVSLVAPFYSCNLRQALQQNRFRTEEEKRNLCISIATAVCNLHLEGIVHRDLKPDNVMITGEGSAIITDLGISQMVLLQNRTIAGTCGYIAPEVFSGRNLLTAAVDVYSLGVLMCDIWGSDNDAYVSEAARLVNRIAEIGFDGALREFCSADWRLDLPQDWPAYIRDVISSCCHRDPSRRVDVEDVIAGLLPVRECEICNDGPRSIRFRPCGHLIACARCAERIMQSGARCPSCRAPIDAFVHARANEETFIAV